MIQRKQTIQNILRSPMVSAIEKKVAIEKWKSNQFSEEYRKDHLEDIERKINAIRRGEYTSKKEVKTICDLCKNTTFYLVNGDTQVCSVCHPK